MQRAGISTEDFVDDYQSVWRYILKQKREHNSTPSKKILQTRFPDLLLPKVEPRDVPILITQIRQRKKYIDLLTALGAASDGARSYEEVDAVIQALQSDLNTLSARSVEGRSHLVDLFSGEIRDEMLAEIHKRKSGRIAGIPTGLDRFDNFAGGLVRQKMVVIIGRPGLGKSWLDLLFVATAVLNGEKVMLYPLEMTLFETAARLYSIFSQKMFGMEKVLRNYDITSGKVKKRDVVRFLNLMEDKFAGQLYLADVSSLSDPYTNERIEAEVEMHKPTLFWVDYITLMQAPGGASNDDWGAVRKLSNGVKNTAMRQDVVGGCSAQVNRSAMTGKAFLPRLENIAYGDSIGQDADQVFSINRNGKFLYYALVKNRGGPEIGKTKVKFDPDRGLLKETKDQDEEE
jgi:replicative DNA helicase